MYYSDHIQTELQILVTGDFKLHQITSQLSDQFETLNRLQGL